MSGTVSACLVNAILPGTQRSTERFSFPGNIRQLKNIVEQVSVLEFNKTIDAVHNRDKFQTFILFSGDSDFEALLKYMKAYRKNCIVVSTKGHVSIELLKQAKFIGLKKLRNQIELTDG